MYMNGVAVNACNFNVERRGRVIGIVSCCYFIGAYLFVPINGGFS